MAQNNLPGQPEINPVSILFKQDKRTENLFCKDRSRAPCFHPTEATADEIRDLPTYVGR